MSEHFYIGAYWGPRKESTDECARRAAALLSRLSRCDERLHRWTRPVVSDKGIVDLESVERAIPYDEAVLKQILLEGQNHYDDKERTIIGDLGFQVCLSTDIREQEIVYLEFCCGLYHKGSGLVNSCAISLPRNGIVRERLLRIGVLEELIDSVVQSWDPDWGTLTSNEYLDTCPGHSSRNALIPEVGWMTYLSNRYGSIPPMPEPSRVLSVKGKGHLIVVTDERFSTRRQDHIEAARQAKGILERAGLLVPLNT